jgi:hypothetical protein
MHGMTGRESVERFSGKRHAVEVAAHGQAVRPALIKDRLEQVRDGADDERRQQNNMVTAPARARRICRGVFPPLPRFEEPR